MKLKSIKFENHPILGNLFVDFCDNSGKPVNTILIAGENGTGKSTLLNEIYKIVTYKADSRMNVKLIENNDEISCEYHETERSGTKYWFVKINETDTMQFNDDFKKKVGFAGIFSDVDINFHSQPISYVTSMNIDEKNDSRKSDGNITKNIQQLIIDIQNIDSDEFLKKIKEIRVEGITVDNATVDKELASTRMRRFSDAFGIMFDDLKYDGVENINGQKRIIFKRGEKKFFLDDLSSGEKQIIYRGSFMLQDINALNGATVLIDEPEISMHPEWQKCIMDFYKHIFTNTSGEQTSQIFAVTHSPFVIHNDFRVDDKVIVLNRKADYSIEVLVKPEYYICNSKEAVRDAFKHEWFTPSDYNVVYLEGRTDEKYFNRAKEVLGYSSLPFEFKWIGHIGANGQEEFTGDKALDKAYQNSLSAQYEFKQAYLYDCDVNKETKQSGNSIMFGMKKFENKRFNAGIENALDISGISDEKLDEFYNHKKSSDNYGGGKIITELKKMEFCDYVCNFGNEQLKVVFANLKSVIDELVVMFEKNE